MASSEGSEQDLNHRSTKEQIRTAVRMPTIKYHNIRNLIPANMFAAGKGPGGEPLSDEE